MLPDGRLTCHTGFVGPVPVAHAAVMNNNGGCSLEFVGTLPAYRRRGVARALCHAALQEAFDRGARLVTVRAINPGTRELYTSLGFRICNT